jgi:hypothetical protein
MKAIAVLLSLTVLLCGCYTQSTLTKDELAPNDEKAFFYLKDGSYVESKSDQHTQIDCGYRVVGSHFRDGYAGGKVEPFEGVIKESDILKVTANKFDTAETVFGVLAVAGVISAAILGVNQH